MPGFVDAINQGIGGVTGTPLGQLGLQLLMASGPQQGNPGFGQRMGQAMAGMSEMQRVQALQQYRDQMVQMQQQQVAMQQARAQRQADADARQQTAFRNPDVQAQLGPLARALAAQGLDPAAVLRANANDALQAHRDAQLAQQQTQFDTRRIGANAGSSGPRMPTQRQVLEKPLGGGMVQRYVLDPQTGQYQEYGQPYPQYSPTRKATTGADHMTDAILNPEGAEAEPVPDTSALPGTGNLQSYAPGQQQGPVGVLPMAAQGGGAAVKPAPKAGMRVPGQPKVARPLTAEDYAALPSGTQYIDPVSGRTATKR